MLRSRLCQVPFWLSSSSCSRCAVPWQAQSSQLRLWRSTNSVLQLSFQPVRLASSKPKSKADPNTKSQRRSRKANKKSDKKLAAAKAAVKVNIRKTKLKEGHEAQPIDAPARRRSAKLDARLKIEADRVIEDTETGKSDGVKSSRQNGKRNAKDAAMTLKDAMLGTKMSKRRKKKEETREKLDISILHSSHLRFDPIDVPIPPIPKLSYGLDRVLFNPGVYLLQDPRSRVYNFDPYLEKIMPVTEFDFDALSEYKTSSKDEELLRLTKEAGSLFTGSTSSMSSILQHFHYLLSNFRKLNHTMLSREYPEPSERFSKITLAPSAVFLRYKDGIYAIDADKSYDTPNIMSWLGHSLEKLLTSDRSEFERYRRSSSEKAPIEDKASRCYHYSKQGNILMRSQLDAVDPRLPGSGVFDLKTRAVVSIRMDHQKYEVGSGYQIRKARGEWESFEREFYDMTRATLLKYSLQVRMGRMDGIFVAFHNIERIFGFQYLSLPDIDAVLHGQHDTSLGNEEFKFSIALLDELLGRAIAQYPNTSLRLHIEARDMKKKFMYVFVEPVTEERAEEIQTTGAAAQREFARTVVGVGKDDPEVQAAWQELQDEVDEQVDEDETGEQRAENPVEPSEQDQIGETFVDAEAVEADNIERKHETDLIGAEIQVSTEDALETIDKSEDFFDDPTELEEKVFAEASPKIHNPANDIIGDLDDLNSINKAEGKSIDHDDQQEFVANLSESDAPAPGEIIPEVPRGPLIGWTLTIRNKVNGEYVDRPEKFTEDDDWELEYHIQDIPEDTVWNLFDGLVGRRRQLLSREGEVDERLKLYRDFIHGYSNRGRQWRVEQDKMDEAKPVQLYKPLGPGSDAWVLPEDDADGDTSAPPSSQAP